MLTFNKDLPVAHKASLLAAVFAIVSSKIAFSRVPPSPSQSIRFP